jgi:F-type H+-transporting ATPase subunit alpha
MPVEEQVVVIYAGVRGYLDALDLKRITAFESHLLSEVRANGQEILAIIRDEQAISDETDGKLKEFMENVVKTFA